MFEQFIRDVTGIVQKNNDEAALLREVSASLKSILGKPDWLPAAYIKPRSDRYAQYPLYVAADGSFSVVSFVWSPGQSTPVHDHTVWGVVGIHQGVERTEAFREVDGQLAVTKVIDAGVGEVGAVSPAIGDVHRVSNVSDEVAVSIHVYGGDIGRINRHVFDEASGQASEFVSGYEPLEPLLAN
jgi:predicted metal-dependent enzyme (double-stranded beta helix superfamily)